MAGYRPVVHRGFATLVFLLVVGLAVVGTLALVAAIAARTKRRREQSMLLTTALVLILAGSAAAGLFLIATPGGDTPAADGTVVCRSVLTNALFPAAPGPTILTSADDPTCTSAARKNAWLGGALWIVTLAVGAGMARPRSASGSIRRDVVGSRG
ncbi:MAG: hypothetical protein QOC93_2201 [Actinomycetota bacterium]|nr:hypothetical protein [Cryptosporangiaceae bacterium]MDQ1677057.1 hypothetical protein [Actinomycetota bacterium]